MNKRRRKPDFLRILALLAILVLIIYTWFFVFIPRTVPTWAAAFIPSGKTNILVIGVDYSYDRHRRVSGRSRSDTLALVQFNPFANEINIISIPRDSYVDVPGRGKDKINTAFAAGGEELAKKTVEQLLGINIHGSMIINLKGLIDLVDRLGGLKIYVDKNMNYNDRGGHLYIDLKKGVQKLDGNQVQGYIRFRHEALGDISRVQRQQSFLKVLFRKMASPAGLVRLPWVLPALHYAIETDIPFYRLAKIANFGRMMPPEKIRTFTMPGNFSGPESPVSYWMLDTDKIRSLKDSLRL